VPPAIEAATTQGCPTCGRDLPVHRGYMTWCECGWNIVAPAAETSSDTRLGRIYASIGRRLGDRLVDELRAAERLEPRWTVARVMAYAVASLVYAGVGLLVGAGVASLLVGFPNPFAIGIALFLFALAWLLRPRFGKPPDENVVERGDAPRLYAVADEVAAALQTEPPDMIVVDHEFNAYWAVVGLRRTRVLALGLPLLSMLEPQERVALIAHELAHARNGDSGRGFFVGGALRALEEVYAVLAPEDHVDSYIELAIFEKLTNMAMWVISRPALGLLYLQLFLLAQDRQRAEYLADALAAEVAGAKASVGLSEKLLLEPTFRAAVMRAARDHAAEPEADLFSELAARTVDIPIRERERRRRVARLEAARLDDTHPPTARRIELLEARGGEEPRVTLGGSRSDQIDEELKPKRRPFHRLLVEEHQDSLYDRWL
jgi:Zn-dependent protease with chaperone function